MLHHAIRENARQWHKCIPFLTWAMRECSNATSGVSPYQMLYGRLPRGPLAILKEVWTGDNSLPDNFSKTEVEYMSELKHNLEVARKYAEDHAAVAQERYVAYYNRNTKVKSFEEGDRVIVLHPDSSNKLMSKWQVGTIAIKKTPNSYLVDMPDGARRHLHANKLRPLTAAAQSVILGQDTDFGDVPAVPVKSKEALPSERIDRLCLTHLTASDQARLLRLIDEFPQVFANKPGLCTVVQHDIITLPGFVPKRCRPYKIPEILKPEVERQIATLLNDGFIRPSTSPMTSPIVCVMKKVKHVAGQDGLADDKTAAKPEVRLAIDYRYLNRFTQPFPFPVPDQNQTLCAISQFKIVSVFDAKSGYHQTLINPDHIWLSAFVTHDAEYEWLRTPFGMLNSGSTFIKAIQEVLNPVREFVFSYVDDMAVGSMDMDQHFIRLKRYFQVMADAGITLNLKKSEWAKSEVKFVGHLVSFEQMRPDPERFQVIRDLARPSTRKELRSVLGMLQYHSTFIPRYAELAKPLTDLTSSRVPFIIPWSDREQQAFASLKESLCNATALYTPRIGELFILRTDASGTAVAGCLCQLKEGMKEADENGTGERPVAFCSKKLSPSQSAWSTIEREAYAVIYALNKFHHIIFGAPIVVYCDHNPLRYLVECAPKSAKLTRWKIALQAYNIDFRFTRGSNNIVADYLSRNQ
jgi:hypothetical protein